MPSNVTEINEPDIGLMSVKVFDTQPPHICPCTQYISLYSLTMPLSTNVDQSQPHNWKVSAILIFRFGDLLTSQLIIKIKTNNMPSVINIGFNFFAGSLAPIHNPTTSISILACTITGTGRNVSTNNIIAHIIFSVGLNLYKNEGFCSNVVWKLIRCLLS